MNSFKKVYLVIMLVAPFLISSYLSVKRNNEWNANVGERIERGVRSNSVDVAREEIGKAISWLEEKKMVEGNSAVTWQTPSSDIAFWFKNLKDVHAKLGGSSEKEIGLEASTSRMSLVETSMVMQRVQQSLLDREGNIKYPMFVSLYPHQVGLFWSTLLGGIMALATVITMIVKCS